MNVKTFALDVVYVTDSLQQVVNDETAFPLVQSAIKGYDSTILT